MMTKLLNSSGHSGLRFKDSIHKYSCCSFEDEVKEMWAKSVCTHILMFVLSALLNLSIPLILQLTFIYSSGKIIKIKQLNSFSSSEYSHEGQEREKNIPIFMFDKIRHLTASRKLSVCTKLCYIYGRATFDVQAFTHLGIRLNFCDSVKYY